MKLKASYKAKDEIPSEYAALYAERGGQWELEVEGMVAADNVSRLEESLRKERNDHKGTKEKFRAFDGLDLDTLPTDLDELSELRALKKAGNLGKDDEAVQKLVDARLAREKGPLERALKKAEAERDAAQQAAEQQNERVRQLHIKQAVTDAAVKTKLQPTAIEDAQLMAERLFDFEDGKVTMRPDMGFVPGQSIDDWLSEMRDRRPHWWPASEGGGATGGRGGGEGGNNPWSAKHWNVTEQMTIASQDLARAQRLAEQAGSSLGATKPAQKAS